jgi:CheY-like chemotaxis protein
MLTKVLIAGDDQAENTGVAHVLSQGGYKLATTTDINEARQMIVKNWPDILIFSFHDIAQAEAVYQALTFASAESTLDLHESILLCRSPHEPRAFDLCMDGLFFLYLVGRPLDSGYALRLAVRLLEQKLAGNRDHLPANEGWHTLRVMVVEDEELQRKIMEKMLKTLGHTVISAADGREALEKLAHEALPHLILMDIRMPGMDGFETITRIKDQVAWQKIPIIILSSSRDIESVTTGIKKGAVDFIVKPVSQLILKKKLASHLANP